MFTHSQRIMSKLDKTQKEKYINILSRITPNKNDRESGSVYLSFVHYKYKLQRMSGKTYFETDTKMVEHYVSAESFGNNLFTIEFKQYPKTSFGEYCLKHNGYFDDEYNKQEEKDFGYYQRPSSEEAKLKILKRLYSDVINNLKDLVQYYYFKKDPYYSFRSGNVDYFNDLFLLLKKGGLSQFKNEEEFIEYMSPIFDKKIEKAMGEEFLKVPFETESNVYLLEPEINFEQILNNGLPTPEVLSLCHVQAEEVEKNYGPKNKICYYFTTNLEYYSEEEFENIKSGMLKIEQTVHGLSAYYYKKDYLLFFSKEEAYAHYKNKLKSVKNQINKVLKEDSIASF